MGDQSEENLRKTHEVWFWLQSLSWTYVCNELLVSPVEISWNGTVSEQVLTRAPLGYFYNAPHWGGGGAISSPPSDLRNYWTDSKNSSDI